MNIVVSAIFKKKCFFLKWALWDSEGGPGRAPRRALGTPVASKGAIRKVDEVHGGPFWRVLDWQKFARAQLLEEKLGRF